MNDIQKANTALRTWLAEVHELPDPVLSLADWSVANRLSKTLRIDAPALATAMAESLPSNSRKNAHRMKFLKTDPVKVLAILSEQVGDCSAQAVTLETLARQILDCLPLPELHGGFPSSVDNSRSLTLRIMVSWNSRTHQFEALDSIEQVVWAAINSQVIRPQTHTAFGTFNGSTRVRLGKPDWTRLQEIIRDIQLDTELECKGFKRHSPERKKVYDRLATTKKDQAQRAKNHSKHDLYRLAKLHLDEKLSVDMVDEITQP